MPILKALPPCEGHHTSARARMVQFSRMIIGQASTWTQILIT